jgi:hypothetical protein
MSTTQTKIRPRVRAAELAPIYSASAGIPEPAGQPASADDSMPPLRLLARLPEVSLPSDKSKLSLNLDWLKRLDWQQVRRIKLDPNWVAGGVLSLVLVLLLVITFNRSSKPAAELPSTDEAPAWNTAGKTPQSSISPAPGTEGPISASTAVPNQSYGDTTLNQTPGGNVSPYASDPAVRRLAVEASGAATNSLEGIYYPRTPHAAIASQPAIAHQTAGQPFDGDEIRTAQRDVIPPYQPPVYSAPPPSGQAHFEGIITRPQ